MRSRPVPVTSRRRSGCAAAFESEAVASACFAMPAFDAKAHMRPSAEYRATVPSSSSIVPSGFFCASGWLSMNSFGPSAQGYTRTASREPTASPTSASSALRNATVSA